MGNKFPGGNQDEERTGIKMLEARTTLGIIGGSSFYELGGLENRREISMETPFGPTPDPVVEGWLGNTRLLFVSRHGKGHRLLPKEVPARAIIFALKKLGAKRVIGVSAVGSLREDIRPGDLAVVRQFIDATHDRPSTFFGNGIVGHIGFAKPVCSHLANVIYQVARSQDFIVHEDTALRVMEGPGFSTLAESQENRQSGRVQLIGMTSMPEAKLAREAELCFVTLALVTDFDCWHVGEEDVSAELVTVRLARNVSKAVDVIRCLAETIPAERNCGCGTVLNTAVVTDRACIPERFRTGDMAPIFGRVLSAK